jgi:predicted DNA-binding protein
LDKNGILYTRVSEEIAKRLEDLSAKTKIPKESLIKEILEEHLAEHEAEYLAFERLNYTEETERILTLYSEVPLYSQNL